MLQLVNVDGNQYIGLIEKAEGSIVIAKALPVLVSNRISPELIRDYICHRALGELQTITIGVSGHFSARALDTAEANCLADYENRYKLAAEVAPVMAVNNQFKDMIR